jgi:hypothetical protein
MVFTSKVSAKFRKPREERRSARVVYYLEPRYSKYWSEKDLELLLKELKFVAEYHGGTHIGLIKFKTTDEKVPSFSIKSLFMLQRIANTLDGRIGKRSNPPVVKRKNW